MGHRVHVLVLLLFAAAPCAFAEDVRPGDQVRFVERDQRIPAHPRPGNTCEHLSLVSSSEATVLRLDASTGLMKVQGEPVQGMEHVGWITPRYLARQPGSGEPTPDPLAWCPPKGALALAAELCAFVGDTGHARLLYDVALPYENHHANVSYGIATNGPMARHLGMLAMPMGDLKRAQKHLEHAILFAECMSSPSYVSLGCIAYGRLLLLGNESGAREHATLATVRALDLALAFGLRALEQECRRIAERAALHMPHARFAQAPAAFAPSAPH